MRQLAHRFVLTENCNATCKHCFNAEVRDGAVMDADLFIDFVRKNSEHLGDRRALLMGGEPTMHPRIIDIILESTKHYRVADLFTNGTRLNTIAKHPEIVREHFKEKIIYTINGYVFDPVKYLEWKEFTKAISLHFVITTWGHKETVEKILRCCDDYGPEVKIVISGDTTVDVFDDKMLNEYRKIWMDSIKKIVPSLLAVPMNWQTDHSFPQCFFTQEMLEELNIIGLPNFQHTVSSCTCPHVGLIGANWDLHYCNQTRIKLGSVLDENGDPKSMTQLVNQYVTPAHKIKTESIKKLRKECKDCNALYVCRVGCYYNTLVKHCSSKGG